MSALSHGDLVDAQLDAYNAQDLDAFCRFYADDAVLAAYGEAPHTVGLEAIRERHAKLFAEFPQNKAARTNRMVVGSVVVDHEDVARGPGVEPFQVLAIYTLAGGKIARVDFVK
jgi:uncharacterized protein (TIGR02246 family)